mmetsp:Transcript_5304/g.12782  ORF Transcript_5304/g.12782 Transcript_5304/m.12782 type:complete len:211 (+) Transcript_5304:43-675(+)
MQASAAGSLLPHSDLSLPHSQTQHLTLPRLKAARSAASSLCIRGTDGAHISLTRKGHAHGAQAARAPPAAPGNSSRGGAVGTEYCSTSRGTSRRSRTTVRLVSARMARRWMWRWIACWRTTVPKKMETKTPRTASTMTSASMTTPQDATASAPPSPPPAQHEPSQQHSPQTIGMSQGQQHVQASTQQQQSPGPGQQMYAGCRYPYAYGLP